MDEKERVIRAKLKHDFLHYAEKCLLIRSKKGDIQPLQLNAAQKYLHDRLEEQLQKTGRVRALVLKGRQQGCSTYVQARFYWKTTHRRGVRAFILTHLDEASQNIYHIVRRFHDNCPPAVKPQTGAANQRALLFDKLDSGYSVGTAKSQGIGRSHTLQYFHGSEVAYWAQAEQHISGVLQAVPDADKTEVILESTSAGASGLFYNLCQDAIKGRSEYIFVFMPWFWQREYRRTPPADFTLTPDEQVYKTEFDLDDAQMCWRRYKIAALGGIWTFRREYPSTPDEAFHSDQPGALWQRETIEKNRRHADDCPEMKRIIIAVDPAVTANRNSDETGIIVAGLGVDDHAYILADLSGKYTPAGWAAQVVSAYYTHAADRVVAEVNQGGDMVEHTLRSFDPAIAYKSVHASRGKIARAEPVAAMDTRGLVHHIGRFAQLEDQMCSFDPAQNSKSPDRVDARTWAVTELLLKRPAPASPLVWGG